MSLDFRSACLLFSCDEPAAILRLTTAVVIDAHDEWQVTRRYLFEISMAELRKVIAAKQSADKPLAEERQIVWHSA